MITVREIIAALYGAIGIARLDENLFAVFDTSQRGFWRSFWAAALVAPGVAVLTLAGYAVQGLAEAGVTWTVVAEVSAYVMSWVLWPLVMAHLAPGMGVQDRLFAYLVPYNWFRVLEIAVLVPVIGASMVGAVPPAGGLFLSALVTAGILFYEGWIARKTLGVGVMTAVLLVAVDFLLHITIDATKTILLTN